MEPILEALSNGVRLMVIEMPYLETVSVGAFINIGGRYETPEQSGISHFVEHMLHQGTGKFNKTALAEQFRALGDVHNAETGMNSSHIWISTATKFYSKAFDVLLNMVTDSTFEPQHVENQRRVILQEFKESLSNPQVQLGAATARMLFGNHPLGKLVIGPEENIKRFSRDELHEFYKTHYQGDNLIICVAGAVSFPEVKKRLEPYLEKISPQKRSRFEPAPEMPQALKMEVVNFSNPQVLFSLALDDVPTGDDRRYASAIANQVLNWRLFDDVREKQGMVYAIASRISRYDDAAFMEVLGAVDQKRLPRALTTVLEHMQRLTEKLTGPTDQEVQMAKDVLEIAFKMSARASKDRMETSGFELLHRERIMPDVEFFAYHDAVTLEQVRQAMRDKLKHPCRALALVGKEIPAQEVAPVLASQK